MTARINVPCNSCQHLPVCSIRQKIFAIEWEDYVPQIEDEALTAMVSYDIDCKHYLGKKRRMSEEGRAAIAAATKARHARQRAEREVA